jgi:hypothetical protein
MRLLSVNNYYCFAFVFPAVAAALVGLLRLAHVLRYGWLAYAIFLVWMALIGYLNMQLFFIAWAGV